MRLILEPSFPTRESTFLQTPFVSTQRWREPLATDADLVAAAAKTASSAVVFLGRQALGRPDVLRSAKEHKVTIIATETYNPIDALDYLRDNLGRIGKKVRDRAEALLVQSNRLMEYSIDELLERRLELGSS